MNEQITDQQKRVIKLQAAAGLYKTLRAELEGIAYCWSETSILLSSADFDALIPPGTEIEQHLYTGDLHETAVLDGVKFTTHGQPASSPSMTKEQRKRKYCVGCRDNVYNNGCGGATECWLLKSAKVMWVKFVPMNQRPPWDMPPTRAHSCFHKTGYATVVKDLTR